MDKKVTKLDFKAGNSEEYKIEAIWDNAVYPIELELGHLSGLYYLIVWKNYPKEENTWEPILAVQHFRNLISLFHKDYPEKVTATFPPVDSAPPMARPTVKQTARSTTKRKQGRLANSANKQAKKN